MTLARAWRAAAVMVAIALGSVTTSAYAFDESAWVKTMRIGSDYRDVGAFDRAEKAFAQALTLEPAGSPAALNHWLLAEAITRQGRFEDAEPALEKAVAVIRQEKAGTALLGEALEALVYVLGRGLAPPERAVSLTLQARDLRQRRNSPWESDPGSLALRHTESGIAFPLRFGWLERIQAKRLRPDWPDVGVKYATMLDNGAVKITCIVYTAGDKSVAAQFEGARDRIAKRFTQAQRLSSGPVTLTTDQGDIQALAARFARVDERSSRTIVEDLYVVERAHHLIKTRITYLAEDGPAAEQQIATLFRRLEWPPAK